MKEKERIRRFHSFTEDFFDPKEECKLPEGYRWVLTDRLSRFLSKIIYGCAIVFSNVYCRLFLHVSIKGAEKLRGEKNTGIFLYGNHTQPVGDVFDPALAAFPKRVYTVVSPANMALPVIGKLLPYLGALPLPENISGMKQFLAAMELRLSEKCCIVIYPEAHLWDYCTFIRPFPPDSFRYPLKYEKPVYCMTATYQKRKTGKKPKITIYIDGPFTAEGDGGIKEKTSALCKAVYDCMVSRSKMSNYEYVKYEDCRSSGGREN